MFAEQNSSQGTLYQIMSFLIEGKTLHDISQLTGISGHKISKMLDRHQMKYSNFSYERQQVRYQKIFCLCHALATSLNRLPDSNETSHIRGIHMYRAKVTKDLMRYGFYHSGKFDVPLPLPEHKKRKSLVLQNPPAEKEEPLSVYTKDMIKVLGHIYKDLGGNLLNNEIIKKVRKNNISPVFDLVPLFSEEKMLRYQNRQMREKARREKIISKLKSISNDLGFSPGKRELRKIDKSFYMKLYKVFGGLHNALKAAGLDKRSISRKNNKQRARNEFIEKLKQHIQQSGKIPEPGELQNLFSISIRKVEKLFPSYVSAVRKAGFSPPLHWTHKNCQSAPVLIARLSQAISLLKRPLKHKEYQILCGSSFATYMRRFGSLKEAHRLASQQSNFLSNETLNNQIKYNLPGK